MSSTLEILFFKDTAYLATANNAFCIIIILGGKKIYSLPQLLSFKERDNDSLLQRNVKKLPVIIYRLILQSRGNVVRSLGWQKPVPPLHGLTRTLQSNWPYSPLLCLCAAKIMLQVRSAQWSGWKLNIHGFCFAGFVFRQIFDVTHLRTQEKQQGADKKVGTGPYSRSEVLDQLQTTIRLPQGCKIF